MTVAVQRERRRVMTHALLSRLRVRLGDDGESDVLGTEARLHRRPQRSQGWSRPRDGTPFEAPVELVHNYFPNDLMHEGDA